MTVPAPASSRLRLDLAYDGTDFSGWAIQPGLRTVQGELEAALSRLLRVPEVRLTVGGRTDAGVHARGQVAHLDVAADLLAKWSRNRTERHGVQRDGVELDGVERDGVERRGVERSGVEPHGVEDDGVESQGEPRVDDGALLRARRLNGALKRTAPDIAIHSVRLAPDAFNARFSALRRRYEYRVRGVNAKRDPLAARFTAEVGAKLDIQTLQRASDELLGLNDFTSFCKAREGATAVRDLLCFEWRETDDGAFAARIEADAFCHSMVRSLVGSVVAVSTGRIELAELVDLRDARERTSRFTVMPAHGLSLEEIAYPADGELAARADQTRAKRSPLEGRSPLEEMPS